MSGADTDAEQAAARRAGIATGRTGVQPAAEPLRQRVGGPPHVPPPFHPMYAVTDTVRSMLGMIVIALFVLTFVVQPFRIPSESMERTLLVGDFLLVNKVTFGPPGNWRWMLPYRDPERGDVVVFRFPLDPREYVVKRVIGVPGDTLHLNHGIVVRNGKPLREPYVVNEPAYRDSFRDNFPLGAYSDPGVDMRWWRTLRDSAAAGNVVVPAGHYFVMGDNRNHSRDSRYWGFVPRSEILGRPFLIYFSLREPSATDVAPLPGDTLGHDQGPVNGVVDFARWDRMFRLVR